LGANLRGKPDAAADVAKVLAEGAALSGEAHAWRPVTDATGLSGWVADEFIVANT
jgi:SH3-like domain-containing protein